MISEERNCTFFTKSKSAIKNMSTMRNSEVVPNIYIPFTDEAQTALFKDPVRTAL
jgi:hypothetical protein